MDSNAYAMNWSTGQEFADWLWEISDRSDFVPQAMTISTTDRIVTLSTCAYDFNEERLVVVGRLVREGESTDVDVSRAVASSSPRYPDKYYKKKGLSNPYATASKWIPNA